MIVGSGVADERWLLASFDDPSKLTRSLPEQIANKLVEGIVKGDYSQGQRLQETAIAQHFSVSRGPVREALRILEREGLVVIRARRGASVTEMSPRRLADIFEVRALLLGLAARKLAQRPSRESIAFLAAANTALEAALDDPEQFLALAYRASMYVAETAGNEIGRTVLFSLGRQTLSVTRLILLQLERRNEWLVNWAAAAAAITRKRPGEAESTMRRLVETVYASASKIVTDHHAATLRGGEDGVESDSTLGKRVA